MRYPVSWEALRVRDGLDGRGQSAIRQPQDKSTTAPRLARPG
nr:MAG TPA: hypothetical protein [Caudoviricetes sp.]